MIFFLRKRKTEKGENISPKMSRILRSLGFGLGLETFANFWRVLVSVLENLVSEKKSRFRFWNKSILFGKFGIGKNVSVSVSVKILVLSFSGPRWTLKNQQVDWGT